MIPLVLCGLVFQSLYMYMHDRIFMQISNQCFLIKDGKSFTINMHKGNSNISLVNSNQANELISSNMKYVLVFLRENHSSEESIRG